MQQMHDELQYGRQRENKLMFFLYVLREEGKYPISELYQNRIRDIPTQRFSKLFNDDFAKLNHSLKQEQKLVTKQSLDLFQINRDQLTFNTWVPLSDRQYPNWQSLGSETASYIPAPHQQKQNKPLRVPILDLEPIRILKILEQDSDQPVLMREKRILDQNGIHTNCRVKPYTRLHSTSSSRVNAMRNRVLRLSVSSCGSGLMKNESRLSAIFDNLITQF